MVSRFTGALETSEWNTLDAFLRLRPSEPTDERILIVGVNETDIRRFGYPVPDRDLALLFRTLQSYQPRAIGLDIFRDLPVGSGRSELAAIFQQNKNLIVIERALKGAGNSTVNPPPELPAQQAGFADVLLDSDGRLRRSLLGINTEQGYKFSLALRLTEQYLRTEVSNGIRDKNAMRLGKTELPRFSVNFGGYIGESVGTTSQLLLNFRGGLAPFRRVSFSQIIDGQVKPDWIRNRVVIIGMTADSVKDSVNTTAVAGDGQKRGLVDGVEIQAHAVSQIISAVLDQRPLLNAWREPWEYLWVTVWGLVGIGLSRFVHSPLRVFLGLMLASLILVTAAYLLLLLGWWIPVVPALLVLGLNGAGLTPFYQYNRYLRAQIEQRQLVIDQTFDAIHNGPLQILARLLRQAREQDEPSSRLLLELEHLNQELRSVYESVRRESLTQNDSLYLGEGQELDLQAPLHEILYEVYSDTLLRDFPCFKSIRIKIRQFDPIDDRSLTADHKRSLCRFLEEALCNVGKYATAATRLSVICTQEKNTYVLRITDNGAGLTTNSKGRGTQQAENLARQLGGKFQRLPQSPKGTVCLLSWPVIKKRFWQRHSS
ncbi:CHASE2 domain-containing protein [Leptolyngbya sp. FACHB-261]|nr:CHASE2 domain-containing protein [Leptolyngbya sp. FACHB-261]